MLSNAHKCLYLQRKPKTNVSFTGEWMTIGNVLSPNCVTKV